MVDCLAVLMRVTFPKIADAHFVTVFADVPFVEFLLSLGLVDQIEQLQDLFIFGVLPTHFEGPLHHLELFLL